MSNSICRFMPEKKYNSNINFIHFVYETDFKKFTQPFFYSIYRMHIVTKGSAVLKIHDKKYKLEIGTIFFAFPAGLYNIDATEDFEYYYISFLGSNANQLLEDFGITIFSPVFQGYDFLIDFWNNSIKRINKTNITVLTESVFLYTLSYLTEKDNKVSLKHTTSFEMIVDYIDNHYRDYDMSLKKVADCFSYTEKYLSHLFKKNMDISFKAYINSLRIQYAYTLIENGEKSLYDIASACGYSDSFYFSKVFKKIRGITPTEYIKNYK